MKVAISITIQIACFAATICSGFILGQSDVRRTTIVRVGEPSAIGVYYGKCTIINLNKLATRPMPDPSQPIALSMMTIASAAEGSGKIWACAADGRRDEDGSLIRQ